ncbi:MAG: LytTR family transcriptional regulator DNA-binding domain-containing protein [Saprospiraceae bacterium]
MHKGKILIVEDEILIADTIQRYVEKQGYQSSGVAISYEEAIQLYQSDPPDLVLIDIRLSGPKSGIDLGHFILQQAHPVPFIYLTSQTDSRHIELAKQTFPAAFLSKPIQPASLNGTIEIALHSHQTRLAQETKLTIHDGASKHIVSIGDILYLQADHIYVQVHTRHHGRLLQRGSLTELLAELPSPPFVQVHRSYVVNLNAVSGWDAHSVFIDGRAVPLSRARRRELLGYLEKDG